MRVGDRPGQAVQFRHHQRVAVAAGRQRLGQGGPRPIRAGQPVIDIHPLRGHPERLEPGPLRSGVLLVGRNPRIPDQHRK